MPLPICPQFSPGGSWLAYLEKTVALQTREGHREQTGGKKYIPWLRIFRVLKARDTDSWQERLLWLLFACTSINVQLAWWWQKLLLPGVSSSTPNMHITSNVRNLAIASSSKYREGKHQLTQLRQLCVRLHTSFWTHQHVSTHTLPTYALSLPLPTKADYF